MAPSTPKVHQRGSKTGAPSKPDTQFKPNFLSPVLGMPIYKEQESMEPSMPSTPPTKKGATERRGPPSPDTADDRSNEPKRTKLSVKAMNNSASPDKFKLNQGSLLVDLPADMPTEDGTVLKLPDGADALLHELEKVERGDIEEQELGRAIRLSRNLRSCISATISFCATSALHNPSTTLACLQTLQVFSKIQKLADGVQGERKLPFLRLPLEVREMIYRQVLIKEAKETSEGVIGNNHVNVIACHKQDQFNILRPLTSECVFETALLYTCKPIYAEAAPVYFKNNVFSFDCTCALANVMRFGSNIAKENMTKVNFKWRGEDRAYAIGSLANLKSLTTLHVTVCHSTSNEATEREEMMRNAFEAHTVRFVRLADTMGIEELLALRGLTHVTVAGSKHVRKNQRKSGESVDLGVLLQRKCILPKMPEGLQ